MFLQIPFCANPFVSHPYKTPGGVGRHTPFLLPDSLPCERTNAPFNKYLWNEHLQKCVKTKDFNYLQNEHLRKTRGEGYRCAWNPLSSWRAQLQPINARVGSISRSARFFAGCSCPLYPRSQPDHEVPMIHRYFRVLRFLVIVVAAAFVAALPSASPAQDRGDNTLHKLNESIDTLIKKVSPSVVQIL